MEKLSLEVCSVFLFVFLSYWTSFPTFLPVFLCHEENCPRSLCSGRGAWALKGRVTLSRSRHKAPSCSERPGRCPRHCTLGRQCRGLCSPGGCWTGSLPTGWGTDVKGRETDEPDEKCLLGVARGGPNRNHLLPRQRPGLCQAVGDAEAGVRGQAVPEQRVCGRPPGPPPGQSVPEGVHVRGQGPWPLPAVSPRSAALSSGRRRPSLWWTLAGAAAETLRR